MADQVIRIGYLDHPALLPVAGQNALSLQSPLPSLAMEGTLVYE
jgi:hypothetical protein